MNGMIGFLQASSEALINDSVATYYLYLAATICFILGIKRLGKVKTARSGNQLAGLGMLLAVVTVVMEQPGIEPKHIAIGIGAGALIGVVLATRIAMTAMPELVAAFNGLGGASSMLVGLAFLAGLGGGQMELAQMITLPLAIVIGAATFTGSFAAYLKLSGKKIKHPFQGGFRHVVHLALAIVVVFMSVYISGETLPSGETLSEQDLAWGAALLVAISCLLGVFLVMPIGGADMPVVVALLNSYSGLAAAASGFVVGNQLLVVAGALVGASGLILTRIMCKAMNRSLGNVLLGGMGEDVQAEDARDYSNIKETSGEEVAMLLDAASSVIIVPGYGLAVAQAQHTTRELAQELESRGVEVRYAIHPVAGRMPGHMNVLLAEADVPYEHLFELEKINSDFQSTDVVLVLGANDVVNPAAREEPESPIYGMPILDVDYAQTVVVVKRSLSPGYAGIKNPLFDKDNTLMVFADAKQALQDMIDEMKEL